MLHVCILQRGDWSSYPLLNGQTHSGAHLGNNSHGRSSDVAGSHTHHVDVEFTHWIVCLLVWLLVCLLVCLLTWLLTFLIACLFAWLKAVIFEQWSNEKKKGFNVVQRMIPILLPGSAFQVMALANSLPCRQNDGEVMRMCIVLLWWFQNVINEAPGLGTPSRLYWSKSHPSMIQSPSEHQYCRVKNLFCPIGLDLADTPTNANRRIKIKGWKVVKKYKTIQQKRFFICKHFSIVDFIHRLHFLACPIESLSIMRHSPNPPDTNRIATRQKRLLPNDFVSTRDQHFQMEWWNLRWTPSISTWHATYAMDTFAIQSLLQSVSIPFANHVSFTPFLMKSPSARPAVWT